MTMRILVIDNNIDPPYWGAWELARFGRLASGATILTGGAALAAVVGAPMILGG